ncbi:FecR family protein, partial [Steroidobacter sp.]|uniref:FecR family protein n=1 Tax=Steroidobacter sp. TaxID=1978227 RepID=UPI001A39F3AC
DRLAALHGPSVDTVELTSEVPAPVTRRYFLAASVAAATVVAGGLSWLAMREEREIYLTGIGEVRRIPLADGSTILLNTDTEVSVQLTDERRNIELRRGEALFEVAHDKSRPFIVRANETAVRAVGTAFAVRLQAAQIDVTVTEGVVELSNSSTPETTNSPAVTDKPPAPRRLSANERAVILPAAAPEVTAIPTPQLSRQLAWREGMVSFDGESLQLAASEINRHNRRQIVVDDPVLAQRPLVGVFRATDVEGFAQAAAATLKARAVVTDHTIRLEPVQSP